MMIIRVLPIHVPPCYEGGYLKPLHWKHIWLMMIIWSDPSMFHDAVSPWSLHIYHYEAMQGQGPHFPPTRKATIHIHRGEGGKGVKMGTLHWGGGGGGACQTWIIYLYIHMYNHTNYANVGLAPCAVLPASSKVVWEVATLRSLYGSKKHTTRSQEVESIEGTLQTCLSKSHTFQGFTLHVEVFVHQPYMSFCVLSMFFV